MKSLLQTVLVFLVVISVDATTYYVSPTGNNSNSGTNSNSAFATLQKAADIVDAGDTVLVDSGEYQGFSVTTSGSKEAPILFRAHEDVIINGADKRDNIEIYMANYVTIDGFQITNAQRAGVAILGYYDDEVVGVEVRNCNCYNNGVWGIFTGYARDVIIENNSCSGSQDEHGIYVSNSADNPIIRNNICFNNYSSGIQINADPAYEGDGIVSNGIIENNVCYGNGLGGGAALNFASIRNCMIRNNLLYDNYASGIAMWDDGYGNSMGCKDNKILNNTVVQASNGRWALGMINESTGNTIKNNILLHLGSRGSIEADQSSLVGLESDNNIVTKFSLDENWIDLEQWQNQTGMDKNSFISEFSEVFKGDPYTLEEGSSAIDKGVNLEDVSFDLAGNKRFSGLSTDIGAYEYWGSTSIISNEKALVPKITINKKSIIIGNSRKGESYKIIGVNGTLVLSGRFSSHCSNIDIQNLSSGVYILSLFSKSGIVSRPFIQL